MSGRRGYKFGPASKVSLRDTPFVDLADASNTAQSFVVVEDSLNTP